MLLWTTGCAIYCEVFGVPIIPKTITIDAATLAALPPSTTSYAVDIGSALPQGARILGAEFNVTQSFTTEGGTESVLKTPITASDSSLTYFAGSTTWPVAAADNNNGVSDWRGWGGKTLHVVFQILDDMTPEPNAIDLSTTTAGSITINVFCGVVNAS